MFSLVVYEDINISVARSVEMRTVWNAKWEIRFQRPPSDADDIASSSAAAAVRLEFSKSKKWNETKTAVNSTATIKHEIGIKVAETICI